MFETIAVFLPLAGACIAGMFAFARLDDEKKQGRIDAAAQWVTCGAMVLSAVFAGVGLAEKIRARAWCLM